MARTKIFDIDAANNEIDIGDSSSVIRLNNDLIVADGKTIGQASGPLILFDDTNNDLTITGCQVGIGATAHPSTNLFTTTAVANRSAIYAVSDSGYGIDCVSIDGVGLRGESVTSFAGFLTINPATANTVAEVLRLRRKTSGSAANGIGGSIDWYIENSVTDNKLTGRISNLLTDASDGSDTSALTLWTRTGGAAIVERVRITGAGILQAKFGSQIGDGGVTNYTNIAADGTITQNGTARIDWTKITANGVTLGDGPPTSGDTVSDLQTAHDGNTYTVSEIAANAGQNLIVDFTGVTAFNWVQILARVEEQAGHCLTVQLEITPFDDSAWHTYHVMKDQAANQNFENYSFFVPDDSAYINSGVVKVRFIHEMNGNANDDWVFDAVVLYQ